MAQPTVLRTALHRHFCNALKHHPESTGARLEALCPNFQLTQLLEVHVRSPGRFSELVSLAS